MMKRNQLDKVRQQLDAAQNSMVSAFEVTDALSAIIDGFAENDSTELSPASVSCLLKCCHAQLAQTLVRIGDNIAQANSGIPD